MRSYSVHQARAAFSELIARALKGEPQRVTGDGSPAVVIVSEADWIGRERATSTLADLFLRHAGVDGYDDAFGKGEVIAMQERDPGSDFLPETADIDRSPDTGETRRS